MEQSNGESKDVSRALNRAYKYVSFRQRTVWEMQQYLNNKDYDNCVIDQVITQLMELQLLDDRHYAVSFAEEKVEYNDNPVGPYRLKYELSKRGVDNDIIEDVLDKVYCDNEREKVLARQALSKKYASDKLTDNKELRRAATYLERKGFSFDVIRDLLFS